MVIETDSTGKTHLLRTGSEYHQHFECYSCLEAFSFHLLSVLALVSLHTIGFDQGTPPLHGCSGVLPMAVKQNWFISGSRVLQGLHFRQ